MSDSVELSVEDGVARLVIAESESRNALTRSVVADLTAHLEDLETRSGVRCLVVEGEGPAFSAGGDVEHMRDRLEGDTPTDESVKALARRTRDTIARLHAFPVPTVAAVDGPAVGAGANLALACDLQLASERASIGFVFRQVGLSVDMGASYLLPRVVGTNVAKELVYTGEVVGAERADRLGLFNHVFPESTYEEEVAATVDHIASGPTVALRHAKRLLEEGPKKSFASAQRDEATAQGVVYGTEDHEEGVEAFFADRRPEFEGR
ncbi:MAG: enoyl-CoA hydratase-related protein [Haloarculaceae archaeon]